jgi:molecular chaperone DnaJ
MKTYYNTLGVSKNASKKEIKAAFCKLSMETHPGVAAVAANVEHFKQFSEAHCILSNENEQQTYDAEMLDPI